MYMLNEDVLCLMEHKSDNAGKNTFVVKWGCLYLSFILQSLFCFSCDVCDVHLYEERIVQRDASPPSSIHYVNSTWPVPLIISISTDRPLDSFKLSSSSHSLTSNYWEDFQGKLIIFYYSWIEPKGTCRIFSVCFLFLYLPRVWTRDAFVCSPVKSQIFGHEVVVAVVFFTAAS